MKLSRMVLAGVAGIALVSGSLVVAAPASADTATYVNPRPCVSSDPTDINVTSFDVDYSATTVTTVAHVTNLREGDLFLRVWVARAASDFTYGEDVVVTGMDIENGVATPVAFVSLANSPSTELPKESVSFTRDVAAGTVTLSYDSSFVPWESPSYFSMTLEQSDYPCYVISGNDREHFGFGPLAQGPFDTTTSLSLSGATQLRGGTPLVASATVSRNAVGSVQFTENGVLLGSGAVVNGIAAFALPTTLSSGVHSIQATFLPAAGVKYQASTSAPTSFTVISNAAATTTKISLSKKTQKYKKRASKLTVTVSAKATGKVAIYDGKKKINTLKVSAGKAKYTLSKKLKKGTHVLKAVFTPTDAEAYVPSTSKKVKLKVTK
jgi:hypothetical protein